MQNTQSKENELQKKNFYLTKWVRIHINVFAVKQSTIYEYFVFAQ